MFCGLSRLRLLSVLLTLVLVAPPLGGSLSARPAAPAASRQPSGRPDNLAGVACPSPSTCVAVGGSMVQRPTDTGKGTIERSTDGGRTWRRQTFGPPDTLTGVACPRSSTCFAVGGPPRAILRTTNGGRTWRRQTFGPPDILNILNGVACPRSSTCFAVAWDGTILRTTNGGNSWGSQTIDTFDRLYGVACPRSSTCVAVGDRGMILRSTDGGRTWRSV